jgi:hypothetical protein
VLDKIKSNLGVRPPLSYANSRKIVGFFCSGQLSACYMLVTKPGFRILLFVPDQEKKKSKFFKNEEFEMMEVNGLWIGPALKALICNLKFGHTS